MTAYAEFVALNQHIEHLRQEAAQRRLLPTGPSFSARVSSVLRNFREAVASPTDDAPTFTPNLSDYPYRS